MAATQNKYDATTSLLGFSYQTRFALLLALRRSDPDVLISIEKIDDIIPVNLHNIPQTVSPGFRA